MGSPLVPYPEYAITLIGSDSGAGSGVPGAAVRNAATGRVVDRIGEMDVFSAVAGTGTNRQFFLAVRDDPQTTGARGPRSARLPRSGIISVRIGDDGTVTQLSAVPGVPEPEPGQHGPAFLAATADGGTVAYPVPRPRPPLRPDGRPAPLRPVSDLPPPEIRIITTATGERAVWRAGSGGIIRSVSLSATGRRMAFDWNGAHDSGICVTDLPEANDGGDITAPSRLVISARSSLGSFGQAVISPDGSKLYVTAARRGSDGQPVSRLAEVSAADGRVLRTVYERRDTDPDGIVFGWGLLAIDPAGQHALIAYTGNLARINLATGQLTELPIEENAAYAIAW